MNLGLEAETRWREDAEAFACNDLDQGMILLANVLRDLPTDHYPPPSSKILHEMTTRLGGFSISSANTFCSPYTPLRLVSKKGRTRITE